MEHKYNELRKQVCDAFVDDGKSGMFPVVDWVMNYLIAQGRIVPDDYVAVPLEPTERMIMAAVGVDNPFDAHDLISLECKRIYRAMIVAARKDGV